MWKYVCYLVFYAKFNKYVQKMVCGKILSKNEWILATECTKNRQRVQFIRNHCYFFFNRFWLWIITIGR